MEEEEGDVVGAECAGVGLQDGLGTILNGGVQGGGGDLGGNLANAVGTGIILRANGLLERNEGVEGIIDREDLVVLASRQFRCARLVEAGELAAEGSIGASSGVAAEGTKCRLDSRGRWVRGCVGTNELGGGTDERASARLEARVVIERCEVLRTAVADARGNENLGDESKRN